MQNTIANIEEPIHLDTIPHVVGDQTAYLYLLSRPRRMYLSVVIPTDPANRVYTADYPSLKALVVDLLAAGFDL